MKFRTLLYILAGLLAIITGFLSLYFTGKSEDLKVFPATVNRDCAPWDGAAFTISIQYDMASIQISIWKSPDMKLPVVFSFPDPSSRLGNATYQPLFGPYRQLNGKVIFWRVDSENPIEGEFNFMLETGKSFKGKFKAEWENQVVMCG